jgi:hypothetical protein
VKGTLLNSIFHFLQNCDGCEHDPTWGQLNVQPDPVPEPHNLYHMPVVDPDVEAVDWSTFDWSTIPYPPPAEYADLDIDDVDWDDSAFDEIADFLKPIPPPLEPSAPVQPQPSPPPRDLLQEALDIVSNMFTISTQLKLVKCMIIFRLW